MHVAPEYSINWQILEPDGINVPHAVRILAVRHPVDVGGDESILSARAGSLDLHLQQEQLSNYWPVVH